MTEVGCPFCGALQSWTTVPRPTVVSCRVCRSELERNTARSLDGALALTSATFVLLFAAQFLPFLSTTAVGVSRHSRMISGAAAMWQDGWPGLAILIALFVVVLPLLRFGLLTIVLGAIRIGKRPSWLGPAFRAANELQPWAMADVFLVGLWVAYARLAATISVELGTGAYCLIAGGLVSLFTRAVLDKRAVWETIGPDAAASADPTASCLSCDLLVPAICEGKRCPRCGDKVSSREPEGVSRAIALTAAGVLFYIPANLFPIATLPINLKPVKYTVLEGVIDLFKANLFGLGLLVFTASFAIPALKLLGLGWCTLSVLRRSDKRLVAKTRVYRIVEELGRWSMVDPFVIACFVPVMRYNQLIYGRAEPAAPAFTAVVVLTMIAARLFDPRTMWDAARAARSPRSAL